MKCKIKGTFNFTCPSLLVETMCVSPVKGKNLAWKMFALCPEL